MNMWDKVLPHRFLIDRALKRASDGLREDIDAYREEHQRAVQRCREEIEAEKEEKNRQFEAVKQQYLDRLEQEHLALQELQDAFFPYVDTYREKELLQFTRRILQGKLRLLGEYSGFLTRQMGLIGEEITLLERRQDALVLQVRTDDIGELLRLTGGPLSREASDDPKTLLERVDAALRKGDMAPEARRALCRLRVLLQERAEYLPVIQYIAWTIQQKKELSRALSRERREIREERKQLKDQVSEMAQQLSDMGQTLLEEACRLRDVWAVPLADIAVKRARVDKELGEDYARQQEIRGEIREMKETRSSDSQRWECLQDEGKTVYGRIGRLKEEAQTLREQAGPWNGRRHAVLELCRSSHVFLLPKGGREADELRVLCQRQAEIPGRREACRRVFEDETAQTLAQRDRCATELSHQLRAAGEVAKEKKERLTQANVKVRKEKKKDDRFFLARLVSESHRVTEAKQHRDQAQRELRLAQQSLADLNSWLQTAEETCQQRLGEVSQRYQQGCRALEREEEDVDLAIAFLQRRKRI